MKRNLKKEIDGKEKGFRLREEAPNQGSDQESDTVQSKHLEQIEALLLICIREARNDQNLTPMEARQFRAFRSFSGYQRVLQVEKSYDREKAYLYLEISLQLRNFCSERKDLTWLEKIKNQAQVLNLESHQIEELRGVVENTRNDILNNDSDCDLGLDYGDRPFAVWMDYRKGYKEVLESYNSNVDMLLNKLKYLRTMKNEEQESSVVEALLRIKRVKKDDDAFDDKSRATGPSMR
ncbi:MAG: hypothetical protein VX737_05460 [Pseudomonadota bacterium]|nr:hypothetical protein [Pseudomonadota bacterium]